MQLTMENAIFSSSSSNVEWGTAHISTWSLAILTHALFQGRLLAFSGHHYYMETPLGQCCHELPGRSL